MTKKWYLSRTIWVAVATVAISGFTVLQQGGDWVAVSLAVLGMAQIVLRTKTDKAVTL